MSSDNDRGQRAIDQRHDIDARLRERDAFEAEFRPSKSGNPWRRYEGTLLTVFPRRDGRWAWSIAGDDELAFSPEGYDTQEHALEALARELGVGEV